MFCGLSELSDFEEREEFFAVDTRWELMLKWDEFHHIKTTRGRIQFGEPGSVEWKLFTQRERARKAGLVGDLTLSQWEAVLAAYGNVCAYCGVKARLALDHVVPLSKGGGTTMQNVAPACKSCNSKKRDSLLEDFGKRHHTLASNFMAARESANAILFPQPEATSDVG